MNPPAIAVSGLHRGENPQPGAGIIRSLRRAWPQARIVGLVYDVKESGIYAEDGPDEVHLMPYPSAGAAAFFERLDALRRRERIDLLIPSLDAEIEILVHLKKELAERGIRVCLPDEAILRRRAKASLPALAETCGVAVPRTRIAHDVESARRAAQELRYPVMLKGPYYEAKKVHAPAQLQFTASRLLAEWGGPLILQSCVSGPEFNLLGLGDGHGGMFGHCSLRKTLVSDQGKGLGGIIVDHPQLDELGARLIAELRWPGPFEIELIHDEIAGEYVLIEMNPRFPAWVDFPSMLGANFPAALVEMMRDGAPARSLPRCPPGSFFLRHQVEVVGHVGDYAGLLEDSIPTPADDFIPYFQSNPRHEPSELLPAAPYSTARGGTR